MDRHGWNLLKIFGVFALIVFGVAALLLGLVIGFAVISEQKYCETMQEIHTDFKFQWQFWGGCLVETPSGFWISAHKYQYLEGDVR